MIDRARIENPRTHYGNAGAATRRFVLQRLSGALNIAFLAFLIWFVLRLAGAERAPMVSLVQNPAIAIILCLLIINVAIHMRIGMREVIEDYIDEGPANHLALAVNTAFAVFVVVLVIGAVAKIVFWG